MLHGVNPLAGLLLAILNIDQKHEDAPPWPKNEKGEDWYPYDDGEIKGSQEYIQTCIERQYWTSGRFRDIYLNEDGTQIILYTRNGGGNRESYWYLFRILRKHPYYMDDRDDDFDSTYAYITFSVPPEYKEFCKSLAPGEKPETIKQKLDKTLAEMESMKPDEIKSDKRFAPVVEMLNKIGEQLAKESGK